METKEKIGVDVDEVVIEFFKKYLKIFNQRFEKSLTFWDLKNYRIWDIADISKEESLSLADEVHDSEHPETVELVENVKESLIKLSKNYQIFFITSRPEKFREKTTILLRDLFEDFNFSLHFSDGVWGKSKTKGEICRELGIKIMVEDNTDYAFTCAQEGIKTFLLDKPWNQRQNLPENIIRVKNWKEILHHLE